LIKGLVLIKKKKTRNTPINQRREKEKKEREDMGKYIY
jgi:hypothetical protein